MTWFKKFLPTLWYDISAYKEDDLKRNVLEACLRHLERGNEI